MQKTEVTKKSYQQWKEHPPHDELPLLQKIIFQKRGKYNKEF